MIWSARLHIFYRGMRLHGSTENICKARRYSWCKQFCLWEQKALNTLSGKVRHSSTTYTCWIKGTVHECFDTRVLRTKFFRSGLYLNIPFLNCKIVTHDFLDLGRSHPIWAHSPIFYMYVIFTVKQVQHSEVNLYSIESSNVKPSGHQPP